MSARGVDYLEILPVRVRSTLQGVHGQHFAQVPSEQGESRPEARSVCVGDPRLRYRSGTIDSGNIYPARVSR